MELQKNLLKIAGLIFIYLSVTSSMALAGTATVSWDANTENDLAGYKVYYGDSPDGNYPVIIDAGNVTSITIDNLTEGTTYYFAVTAYDVSGNESGFSQEVSATISSAGGGGDNNTNLPPKLLKAAPMGETQIDVIFNEALDQTSAENASNYTIDRGIQVIGAILGTNESIVHLITTAHEKGLEYVLSVQNVKDQEGEPLASGSFVTYTIPDPTDQDTEPPTLLYVVITDETHLDIIFSEPVQSNSAQTLGNYSITNSIRVLDATLNNNESVVHLITSEHQRGQDYRLTVNGIEDVSGNAMQSSSKQYKLTASGDSDNEDNGDTGGSAPPTLVSVEFQGSTQIDVTFSEPLDKATAENVNNYSINNNIEVKAAILSANSVTVHLLTSKHDETEEYTLVVRNIQSASGVAVSAGSGITYSKSGDNGVGTEPEPAFSLLPNWPNPFNPETQIRFYLEKGRKVELKIYNAIGQHIRTLVTGDTAPGFHSLIWDGTNTDGLQVPSGVYLYTLEVKREVQKGNLLVNVSVERRVRKMTLIR